MVVTVPLINSIGNAFLQPIFIQILTLGLQALPLTLTFWTNNDRIRDQNGLQNPPPNPETYDFIVVGAGCAGAVVGQLSKKTSSNNIPSPKSKRHSTAVIANRLSRNYKVLLLEAGGEPNPIQSIPLFAQYLLNYPEVDYGYRTVPQKDFNGLVNKQVSISAGKGLGGSASLNLLVYLRGHFKDYDNWASITGDSSWSWAGVLPFFKSYEDYEIPGDNVNHGYGGELRIEAPDYIGTAPEFVAAGRELGYPNVDLNAPFYEGFDVVRYPIRSGQRQATYKAFIETVRTRLTLTIRKFAQVNKILMRDGNIAYGVEYDRHGKTYAAYATREVIVSAGPIETPKLLMISGIGPSSQLQALNIPVVADLPVGDNLKDHLVVLLGPFFLSQPRSINQDRDITMTEFVKWATVGTGRLTTSTAEATGLISTYLAKSRGEGDWPDVQFLAQCVTMTEEGIPSLAHAFNLKLDEITQYLNPAIDRDACFVGVINSRPFSKGFVKLGGRSPYDIPIIQPNYFENEVDWMTLVEGIKTAVVLMENTTAFGRNLGARFTNIVLPGCEGVGFRSDAYWECYVKTLTFSIYHPSGTSSMGKVVDTDLKVFDVQKLRVIDQSVSPEHISTNTMASTLMIAEKGSYMILQDWKRMGFFKNNQRKGK